jgi:hypothetical protein
LYYGYTLAVGSPSQSIIGDYGPFLYSSDRNADNEIGVANLFPIDMTLSTRPIKRLDVPVWSIFLIAVMISAAAWLPYSFSLRTLPMARTLVAVGLGWLVYAIRN